MKLVLSSLVSPLLSSRLSSSVASFLNDKLTNARASDNTNPVVRTNTCILHNAGVTSSPSAALYVENPAFLLLSCPPLTPSWASSLLSSHPTTGIRGRYHIPAGGQCGRTVRRRGYPAKAVHQVYPPCTVVRAAPPVACARRRCVREVQGERRGEERGRGKEEGEWEGILVVNDEWQWMMSGSG